MQTRRGRRRWAVFDPTRTFENDDRARRCEGRAMPQFGNSGDKIGQTVAVARYMYFERVSFSATVGRSSDQQQRVRLFPLVRQAMEKDIMIKDFNVSEKGHGSYWLLGILRWVMVLIFISFGIQKFTPESAHGIALYISNSPFVSWLSIFGIRGEAYLLGIIELTTAALLAAGAFIPILSVLGSLMGIGTFAITWSFFFSTPGVVKWSVSADPIAWNLTGEFLYKDVVLLCVCIVLFLASLPKKVVPLRSN
jgi:uncharacterized membrane protein YkgB